jgi:hypothetical protein
LLDLVRRLDLLDLPPAKGFDIVVVNAVLFMMTDGQFQKSLASLAGSLAPAGLLWHSIFFHPFPQKISIVESSDPHPDGLPLNFRPIPLCSRTSQEGRIECARHRAPRKIVRDKGDVSAHTHTNTCVIDKHFVQVDCRETSRFLPSPSSASDAAQLEWDGTAWSLSLPWPAADQRDRESVLVELVTCSASVRHGWLDFP